MTVFPIQRAAMRCQLCNAVCDRKSRKRQFCIPCGNARQRTRLATYKASMKSGRKPGALLAVAHVKCESCEIMIRKRTSQHRFCNECRRRSDLESRRKINARHRASDIARSDAARRQRDRRAAQPKYAIAARMSAAIYQALREGKAGRSWEIIVGFTLDELVEHLQRQFAPGMSWANYGSWHIDHVRPIASFVSCLSG